MHEIGHRQSLQRAAAGLSAALLLACATVGHAHAARGQAVERSVRLESGGLLRSYEVHVPPGRVPAGGFPVILAFHGGGGDGKTMARLTHLNGLSDARGFIAIYPDGIDKHWNDGRATIKHPVDDVAFVGKLLDEVQHAYRVDPRRVYATGISNGALFAERLGCEMADRVSAIAPVAGTLPAALASACRPSRHVGVLQIDGTADPIMPYGGGNVADFGGRGEGGQVLSVRNTFAFWVKSNGCGNAAAETPLRPTRLLDRTRVTRTKIAGCPNDGPVELLTIEGERPCLAGRAPICAGIHHRQGEPTD